MVKFLTIFQYIFCPFFVILFLASENKLKLKTDIKFRFISSKNIQLHPKYFTIVQFVFFLLFWYIFSLREGTAVKNLTKNFGFNALKNVLRYIKISRLLYLSKIEFRYVNVKSTLDDFY